ncbi:uncharacterized protein TRIVIDRAFT_192704 [Trichoderma virens Gv29-8]|uniref:Uncharacterized protein n=1 Tax=Hypocrea virens (strain Gv29-8 / FGSC 10586) TaxID=413071 RepID=G9MYN4_HYPVG|nr:uncharacterized protein TRIVIDRAFT_192704 [Trichoderma virens Gv29-8]EHK20448.1 hypothetical protein TRIVIDRAFT_192704 [Trichoderma virens Gv29-8]UKZ52912.1 hypothetical protein TrVGV298_006698 [Trichoderma virens]
MSYRPRSFSSPFSPPPFPYWRAYSWGPTKSRLTNVITTITPGKAPTTQTGKGFFWPGISNGTGDLIRTTLESHNAGPYTTGYGIGTGTGTKRDGGCSSTIAAQTYINTVIALHDADENFGSTISTSQGATYSGLSHSSDYKTWTIAKNNVSAMK